MCNYAAPQANGHSIAFDGIAFATDESSRNMKLVEAGESEGVFIADFDLERLRAYRAHETWGDAFRKPRTYVGLTAEAPVPPFFRPENRR